MPIQITYLIIHIGFNLAFGAVLIIGIRCFIKMRKFKKREQYFTTPGKVKFVRREEIKNTLSGREYKYFYKLKIEGTETIAELKSIANPKVGMDNFPQDDKWHEVKANPENHREFRFDCEDNAIKFYRKAATILISYGLICRVIFELFIWSVFLEEGGLS